MWQNMHFAIDSANRNAEANIVNKTRIGGKAGDCLRQTVSVISRHPLPPTQQACTLARL